MITLNKSLVESTLHRMAFRKVDLASALWNTDPPIPESLQTSPSRPERKGIRIPLMGKIYWDDGSATGVRNKWHRKQLTANEWASCQWSFSSWGPQRGALRAWSSLAPILPILSKYILFGLSTGLTGYHSVVVPLSVYQAKGDLCRLFNLQHVCPSSISLPAPFPNPCQVPTLMKSLGIPW